MTCRELIAVLDDYLDGALPDDVRCALDQHLDDCAPCRAYLATYRKTRELGAAANRIEIPEEVKRRLRRLLLDTPRGS